MLRKVTEATKKNDTYKKRYIHRQSTTSSYLHYMPPPNETVARLCYHYIETNHDEQISFLFLIFDRYIAIKYLLNQNK